MPRHHISTIADWDPFISDLLSSIKPGAIIALSGPLGAGKTTFVQSLARALDITVTPTSPTFSLVRTYPVKQHPLIKKLIHVDAYRIEDEKDIMTLGLEELLAEKGSLMCLEWPEKVASWVQRQSSIIHLTIAPTTEGGRTVTKT